MPRLPRKAGVTPADVRRFARSYKPGETFDMRTRSYGDHARYRGIMFYFGPLGELLEPVTGRAIWRPGIGADGTGPTDGADRWIDDEG